VGQIQDPRQRLSKCCVGHNRPSPSIGILLYLGLAYASQGSPNAQLLLDPKRRGLDVRLELTIAECTGLVGSCRRSLADHARAALLGEQDRERARQPRKSQQPKAKRALQEIWMADAKADAEAAFDAFIQRYRVKYAKAAECLNKDRDALVTSYDFPAGHWKHLRTTNPIESTSQP
jgi:putative transposase